MFILWFLVIRLSRDLFTQSWGRVETFLAHIFILRVKKLRPRERKWLLALILFVIGLVRLQIASSEYVMVSLHFQLGWIYSCLADMPLGVSRRVFSGRINWVESFWAWVASLQGTGSWTEGEGRQDTSVPVCAFWLWTQCDQPLLCTPLLPCLACQDGWHPQTVSQKKSPSLKMLQEK